MINIMTVWVLVLTAVLREPAQAVQVRMVYSAYPTREECLLGAEDLRREWSDVQGKYDIAIECVEQAVAPD